MPNQGPVINPSPKARFMQTAARIHAHREMVSSLGFEQSADFALLQYQFESVMQIRDQGSAMAAGLKMEGALEFLNCFKTLAESVRPMAAPVSSSLNPNA